MGLIYKIFVTDAFEKDFQKLSRDEQRQIEKVKVQLRSNPFVGKPLGYRFFREKKIGGNRLYYLIYETKVVVLVVAYSGKKEQQATINAIKAAFEQFKRDVDKSLEGLTPLFDSSCFDVFQAFYYLGQKLIVNFFALLKSFILFSGNCDSFFHKNHTALNCLKTYVKTN